MLDLKLNIKDIGPEGVRVERRFGAEVVRALLGEVPGAPEDREAWATLALQVDSLETTILARGSFSASFQLECSRCLAPATISVDEPELTLTYLPSAAEAAGEEGEESEALEDVGTYVHDGVTLDLEPMVREQLVLAIPIAPLCRPDCRGLCTGCGAELNREACTCSEKASAEVSKLAVALGKLRGALPK
ncbi:MAG: DUF177 domain-containing protein [Deltaproteobacteria bacterium]|nr:DUF177 domain-containing protein [Deltaproteobacteria bacterium]